MVPKSELRFNTKDHSPTQKILEIYPIYKLGASYIYELGMSQEVL